MGQHHGSDVKIDCFNLFFNCCVSRILYTCADGVSWEPQLGVSRTRWTVESVMSVDVDVRKAEWLVVVKDTGVRR